MAICPAVQVLFQFSSRFDSGFVPPYLLERISRAGAGRAGTARRARPVARRRAPGPTASATRPRGARHPPAEPARRTAPHRTIADCHGSTTLPGDVVRREGEAATGDAAADEAYDGLGATWALYLEVYGRDSLDGHGLPLDASVHYGEQYDNAFWDGTRMVFGDGDGVTFTRFTAAVDVMGHELTHGVTQLTAGLAYRDQSGALNESVSDVFGSLVKQRALGQDAASADWLIGAGLFTDQVKGVALRSMKAPGTAYDDPTLGQDPQPATMSGYVTTTSDNGGVHINSGIPNHAFYLAATAIGGNAWEGAGQIWYDVLTGGTLARRRRLRGFRRRHDLGRRCAFRRRVVPAGCGARRLGPGGRRRRGGRRRAASARPRRPAARSCASSAAAASPAVSSRVRST